MLRLEITGRRPGGTAAIKCMDVVKDMKLVGVKEEDVDEKFRGMHAIGCCNASRDSPKQAGEGDHLD